MQGRIQDFLIGGEPNNLGYRGRGTNERSELRAKRVTSEACNERSELRAKRVTSEASYERSEYKSGGGIFVNLEPLRVNLSVI